MKFYKKVRKKILLNNKLYKIGYKKFIYEIIFQSKDESNIEQTNIIYIQLINLKLKQTKIIRRKKC